MNMRAHLGLDPHEARLNITWDGQNADLPEAVAFDASDTEIKRWAVEAVRAGSVPGLAATYLPVDELVVDRFAATAETPYHRIFLRPKTPFG